MAYRLKKKIGGLQAGHIFNLDKKTDRYFSTETDITFPRIALESDDEHFEYLEEAAPALTKRFKIIRAIALPFIVVFVVAGLLLALALFFVVFPLTAAYRASDFFLNVFVGRITEKTYR